jgi:protein tyrosine phosphatase (PTP) superfamily phosphohydrolase (DUF442 family)
MSEQMKWKRVFIKAAIGGALLVAVCGALAFHMGVLGENFRPITEHQCYRSGQMTLDSLNEHVHALGLKSVINLRGVCADDWYKREVEYCSAHQIAHVDFKIDPVRLPRPEVVLDMIRYFKAAEYPLILHCRNGADRSGLAATLYRITKEKEGVDSALQKEVNWHCGHVRTTKNDAAERFFELYRRTGNGESFESWAENTYPKCYTSVGPYGSADKTTP